ncbi:MAG: orotate phosphoribosyltransferase [Candidatus Hodarchaeota archaeon]
MTTPTENILKTELLIDLYKAGAIKFGTFTLKSGEISPYYIQLRELSSYKENVGKNILKKIGTTMGGLIYKNFPQVDRIVGVAYAGIPLVVAITLETGIPSCYTRKEIKTHGISRFIEGQIEHGDTLVIVDDLVTTGESKLEARETIQKESKKRKIAVEIKGVTCLFDREEGGIKFLAKEGLDCFAQFTISEAVKMLHKKNLLQEKEYHAVMDYVGTRKRSM